LSEEARQDVVAIVAGLCAGVLFLWLELVEGGAPETVWYPATIGVLGLAAVVVLAGTGVGRPLPRDLALAIGALTAFTLWSFATVLWADDRAIALDGSAKTLLYLTAFALFALLPWRRRSATAVVAALTLTTAAVGLGVFLLPEIQDHSSKPFLFGRFADPVGYPNGNAALLLSFFWPAVILASRRELPPLLRGALAAAAGALAQLAVATQSRGAAVAGAAVLVLVLAAVPGRLRLLAALVPIGVATLVVTPRLLRMGDLELSDREVQSAVSAARTALLLTLVLLFALGVAAALADRRLSELRLPRRSLVVASAAVALGAVVAAALSFGVVTRALDRVDEARAGVGNSRFSDRQVDGGRVELWRVGMNEFRRHPVAGIGVDNFAIPYARQRKVDDEEPLYPHSVVVKLLSQTGLVGSALFVAFAGAAGLAAFRSGRRPGAAPLAVAASAPAVYWAAHGTVDWLWELPALSAPVFALLGLAGRVDRAGEQVRSPWSGRVAVAAGVACLVAAAALVPLWLSARELDAAGIGWRDDPAAAFSRLDRAAALNPVSDAPASMAGAIASRLGRYEAMAAWYEDALERKRDSWYSHLQLSVARSLTGERQAALASIGRARELNPLDRLLADVERQLRAGRRLDAREIDSYFVEQAEDLSR
jgi:O-antigen ligase